MKKQDQASSLFLLALSAGICLFSVQLPVGSWREPGPGFLPLGSGLFLGSLSLILFSQALRRKPSKGEGAWFPKRVWKLLLILILLLGYAFSMEVLGFLIGTFLLLLLLFRIVEPQRWAVSFGGGALTSSLAYAIFEWWLRVRLPKGFLGF